MDRGSILSGGAFRVTVYATAVLALVFLLTAMLGYRYLQQEQYEQSQDRIQPIITMFQNLYEQGGDQAVAEHISRIKEAGGHANNLLTVFNEEGRKVAGAFNVKIIPQDWHVRTIITHQEMDLTGEYYLTSVKIGAHTFVIGEDLAPLERIETIFIRTLAMIGAFLGLVFIALGYGTSSAIERKLEQMGDTLERVSDGDTNARLSLSNANDQIDRLSRKMNGHLDRLSALMTATKSNAAAIAHDLKRPLARASLGIERAAAEAEAGKDNSETLHAVRTELSNLTGIFDTILRIARIENNQGDGKMTQVDLLGMVQDLGETFQVAAEESGQSLTIDTDGIIQAQTRGYVGMLTQMLANLLQNAISHGGSGNQITLSLRDRPDGIVLAVSDRGPGIAPEEREKVLTAFYRADAARTTEGNGLGLALVKSVVDRHGALLRLSDNEPGLRVTETFARGTTSLRS